MDLNKVKFKKEPIGSVNGKPIFINNSDYSLIKKDLDSGLINTLKIFFRKIPWLYSFIFYFIAPTFFVGKSPRSIYKYIPSGGLVAEVASGNQRLNSETITVDIYPWNEVDIVADAHDLPLADNSIDGFVFPWALEHMRDPKQIAREFRRALKPGGHLYLSTNFVLPYHPSPKDYYRWTADGLRELFSDFEILEIGVRVGPTCAFTAVLQEWVSTALSFNIKFLKDIIWILMVVISAPIKVLDLILAHYKFSESLAAGLYLIARKKQIR